MGVTTTETLRGSVVRCRCGREARGGVLIQHLAACCLRGADLELVLGMIGDAPKPGGPEPTLVAADPLSRRGGPHPVAAQVIARIRAKRQKAQTPEEKLRYSQAHPEVVAEVLREGGFEVKPELLAAPSIPPVGEPDPLMADIRPPLRSRRMATRQS